MENMILSRENILNVIKTTLEGLDYVNAMWQCGSSAFKRADDWSDLDIAVDVEDDKVRDIFDVLDKVLEDLSPIENSFGCPQLMSPGGYQKVYKLKDLSRFLLIEICAVKHSSTDKFIQREIHGDIIVHFDKKNVTKHQPLDKKEFESKLKLRINDMDKMFNIYTILVEKELNRKNYIEAVAFYNNFTLNPLVELLRIKHSPYRYSFKSRYVYYDLPEEVFKKLENLYFIKDGEDLRAKHQEVIIWFNELVEELRDKNLMTFQEGSIPSSISGSLHPNKKKTSVGV